MSICVFLAGLALGAMPADVQTFTDPYLGLTFTHPKTWVLKPKAKRDVGVSFLIPSPNGASKSTLDVIRTSFQSAPELWQTVQRQANEQLQRTITRQWEQEVLGVPLLLTQVEFSKNGSQYQSLIGLLYAKGPQKLLFRLTANSSDYENVQYEFQTVLESLRTTDGALPKVEDGKVPTGPTTKPTLVPRKSALKDADGVHKPQLGPVHVDLTVSTKPIRVYLPLAWNCEVSDNRVLNLTKKGLVGTLQVKIFTTLDSDTPNAALTKQAGENLLKFDVVNIREDIAPYQNRAGTSVSKIWRSGKGPSGSFWTLDGIFENGEWYGLFAYSNKLSKTDGETRVILNDLISQFGVLPRP